MSKLNGNSTSILFGIAGLVQLELTGFFDMVFQSLSEAAEAGIYPGNIYRQIISNPETPCRTFIKELIYFNRKFGLGLLLLSAFIQPGAIWIKV